MVNFPFNLQYQINAPISKYFYPLFYVLLVFVVVVVFIFILFGVIFQG
jgi:hypothetical protein